MKKKLIGIIAFFAFLITAVITYFYFSEQAVKKEDIQAEQVIAANEIQQLIGRILRLNSWNNPLYFYISCKSISCNSIKQDSNEANIEVQTEVDNDIVNEDNNDIVPKFGEDIEPEVENEDDEEVGPKFNENIESESNNSSDELIFSE